MRSFLLFALLAACSAPTQTGPAATPPQNTPAEPVATDPVPPSHDAGPGIGEKCADGDVCATGLECVKYYGIAGPRGPQFSSCEKRCTEKSACPEGTACTTIADGPGAVCRPS